MLYQLSYFGDYNKNLSCANHDGKDNKELPPNFGKAKVREIRYCKNFEKEFSPENQQIKKTPGEVF